jgi:ligand-binding sensor domain-containing protein
MDLSSDSRCRLPRLMWTALILAIGVAVAWFAVTTGGLAESGTGASVRQQPQATSYYYGTDSKVGFVPTPTPDGSTPPEPAVLWLEQYEGHYKQPPDMYAGKIGCGYCVPPLDGYCPYSTCTVVAEPALTEREADVLGAGDSRYVFWHLLGHGPSVTDHWRRLLVTAGYAGHEPPPADVLSDCGSLAAGYMGNGLDPEDENYATCLTGQREAYQFGCLQAWAFLETYERYYRDVYRGNTLFVDIENPICPRCTDETKVNSDNWVWGHPSETHPYSVSTTQQGKNRAVLDGHLDGLWGGMAERGMGKKQIGVYTSAEKWREIMGEGYYEFEYPVVLWIARYLPAEPATAKGEYPVRELFEEQYADRIFAGHEICLNESDSRTCATSSIGGYNPAIWQFTASPQDLDMAIQDPGYGFSPRPAASLEERTLEIPIIAGSDDAGDHQDLYNACSFSTAAHEIHFGQCYDGQSMTSGFRFADVDIPLGAEIKSAYIRFSVADSAYEGSSQLILYGEYSADAQTFSDESRPADRSLTGSSAAWHIPADDTWQLGEWRYSPDISHIIQEIIDRRLLIAPYPTLESWTPGNSLAIVVKEDGGPGYRAVVSFEQAEENQSAGSPATLVVTYREASVEEVEVKANLEVRQGSGSCPRCSFGVELYGMSPLADYEISVEDASTGNELRRLAVEERDGLGRASVWPLLTVAPGEAVDLMVTVEEIWRTLGQVEVVMAQGVHFTNACMGNDHPDDNLSASSYSAAQTQSQLPSGAPSETRVAVLSSGFFWGAEDLAGMAGEPADWINADFDPATTAARYPVLIIPSGGLSGLDTSASFRARLEEYARLGGTIVAFSQQHGYEFAALPGGEVGGYGWSEDISCSGASLFMETWHPILSGFGTMDVRAHVDGYLDAWPEEAQVILSRKANGKPAAILYPYGDGHVFVTTMYDDWGAGNGQSYPDAQVLVRDLVTWAVADGEVARFAPGSSVVLDVPVVNDSPYEAAAFSLALFDPSRHQVLAGAAAITVPVGGSATLPLTTTADTPLGLWRVDTAPLGTDLLPMMDEEQAICYAVAQPPAIVDPARDLYLSITAPDNVFIEDTEAVFTYHVYNYGDEPLVADVHYGFDHDFDWKGIFRLLADDVVLPAAENGEPGEIEIPFSHVVDRRFRLRGHVIADAQVAYASFGVEVRNPEIAFSARLVDNTLQRGQEAVVNVTAARTWGQVPLTTTVRLSASDASQTVYHTALFTIPLTLPPEDGGSQQTLTHTFTLPTDLAAGTGRVWIEARTLDGVALAGERLALVVPSSPLSFCQLDAAPSADGSAILATIVITNHSSSLPVGAGVATLMLHPPDGSPAAAVSETFILAAGASGSVGLQLAVPDLVFGSYTLETVVSDEYGEHHQEDAWAVQPIVEARLDKPSHRAGELAELELTITNAGPFRLALQAMVASGVSNDHVESFVLQGHGDSSVSFYLPIRSDTTRGTYPLTLALTLPGGSQSEQQVASIRIPPSRLTFAVPEPSVAAGGSVLLYVANEGGANTTASYELSLMDVWGTTVATWSGAESLVVGQSLAVSLPVPADAASGPYTLGGSLVDEAAEVDHQVVKVVTIQGTEASLAVDTDRPAYLADDVMQLSASIENGDIAFEDAILTWRVTQLGSSGHPPEEAEIALHSLQDAGIGAAWVANDMEVDEDGNVWVATGPLDGVGGGVAVLHPDGTHTSYTTANSSLSADSIVDVAVNEEGIACFVTEAGEIDVRYTDGTWYHFDIESSLLDGAPATAVEFESGEMAFVVLDGQGIRKVNVVYRYENPVGDGLCSDEIYTMRVDAEERAWFAPYDEGVCMLERRYGSNAWTTYTPADSGIGEGRVTAISSNRTGDVYFGHCGGGVAATVLRTDSTWEAIGYPSVPGGAVDCTEDLEVDRSGNLWFSFSGDSEVLSVLVDDPSGVRADEIWYHYGDEAGVSGGIAAIATGNDGRRWVATPSAEVISFHGVYSPFSLWETYTEPFVMDRYRSDNPVQFVVVDTAGNRWFMQHYCYEGCDTAIYRLGADDTSWDQWHTWAGDPEGDGIYDAAWTISDMNVDGLGRLWLSESGSGPYQGPGYPWRLWLGTLEGDQWVWEGYTAETTEVPLPEGAITEVADPQGRMWFGGSEGGVSVLSGTTWITYTTSNSGLPSDHVVDLAVDPLGNAWFALGYQYEEHEPVVALRREDGTWLSFSADNSPLPWSGENIRDVAVDRQGNAYFAVGGYDPRLHEDLDEAVAVYRAGSGDWLFHTMPEALAEQIRSVTVDHDGRVWLIVGDGPDEWHPDPSELVSLSPHTGQFARVADTPGLEAYSDDVRDVAVDGDGDLWVGWGGRYEEGAEPNPRWLGAATRYSPSVRTIWQSSRGVSLSGSEQRLELLDVLASDIGATGQLHLEGELRTASGQRLAWDEVPFTIFEGSVPALSLVVAPSAARPGGQVLLSGSVRNATDQPLDGYAVSLAIGWGDAVEVTAPGTIAVGETWQYSLTVTAPPVGGAYDVVASDGISSLTERLEVVEPQLRASLEAPAVAGRQPFGLVLKLTNPTLLPVEVDIDLHGESLSLSLPAGESRALVRTYSIEADTTFDVAISGDVTEQLSRTVLLGEALEARVTPDAVYVEGAVAIPYALRNVGQVPLTFSTDVMLEEDSGGVDERSFESYLAGGEIAAGELLYDLAPGNYTLSYSTPLADGQVSFSVAPLLDVSVVATVGVRNGSLVTVTVLVENDGMAALDGLVRVQLPFFETESEVGLDPGGSEVVGLPVDLYSAAGGVYSAAVSVLSGAGQVLASTDAQVSSPGANLVLISSPSGAAVAAGDELDLEFGVENRGAAAATAVISVTVGDLLDEAQSLWLAPGEAGTLRFQLDVPRGLAVEAIVGEYWFEGQRHDLTLPVMGVVIDVAAQCDQHAYAPGETATLQLTVVNVGDLDTPEMYAHVAYAGQVISQPISVTVGSSQTLAFELVAQEAADPRVFYALYESVDEVGVVLNTTYLRVYRPDVTVVLDSHVYAPGDIVSATIVTTATGELVVSGPGISDTIQLPSAGFQFTLPSDLQRGTRWLDYGLSGGPTHQAVFDVDAPWVRVSEALLLGLPYAPGDQVELDLTIASTDALDVDLRAYLVGPDAVRGEAVSTIASLGAALNNRVDLTLPLTTGLAGRFQLVYVLTAPGDPEHIYAAGSKSFDVGVASILALRGSEPSYPGSGDPVQVEVSVYASEPGEGVLALLVDGDEVSSETVVLPGGSQTVSVDVPGPLAPGWHTVAVQIEAGGLATSAQFDLAYGTDSADLATSSLGLAGSGGPTRTLRARVENRGREASAAATAEIWDGGAGEGTLLGTVQLPELGPSERFNAELVWDVLGQSGVHTITVVVDPEDLVAEFHEGNNVSADVVQVPALDLVLDAGEESYRVGQTVGLTATMYNLTDGSDAVTLTVSAMLGQGVEVFSDELALTLPAGGPASEVVVWQTTGAPEGQYSLLAMLERDEGEYAWATAEAGLEQTGFPPQVDVGPDLSGDEGSSLAFSATVVDEDTPGEHELLWDFGDGTVATGSLTQTKAYADDGEYRVTLTLTDTGGLTGTDALSVTIANVAPVVDAGVDLSVDLGDAVAFSGSFSDPGTADDHAVIWDFGDGSVAVASLSPVHTYAEAGVYTANLTVEDDDGGVGSDSVQVVVRPILQAVDVRHAVIHWWSRESSQLHMMLRGELQLPEGYKQEDLVGDITLRLTIAGQTVSETVSLRRWGWVWHYHRAWHDGQLMSVHIIWPHWGRGGSAQVFISGVFSVEGANAWTTPAEAELELRLPLESEPELEWVSGKVVIEFNAYGRIWWYRACHRVWPRAIRRFWMIPTPWLSGVH